MKSVAYTVVIIATIAALLMMIFPVNAEEDLITPLSGAINSSEPFITIDPIGNRTIGEVFFINGTTNLPISENLTIYVNPITPPHGGRGRKEKGIVVDKIPIFTAINGVNHWSVNVTDGYWTPEYFLVIIGSKKHIPQEPTYQSFLMVEPKNNTPFFDIPNSISTVSLSEQQTTFELSPMGSQSTASPFSIGSIVISVFLAGIALQISEKYKKWR